MLNAHENAQSDRVRACVCVCASHIRAHNFHKRALKANDCMSVQAARCDVAATVRNDKAQPRTRCATIDGPHPHTYLFRVTHTRTNIHILTQARTHTHSSVQLQAPTDRRIRHVRSVSSSRAAWPRHRHGHRRAVYTNPVNVCEHAGSRANAFLWAPHRPSRRISVGPANADYHKGGRGGIATRNANKRTHSMRAA